MAIFANPVIYLGSSTPVTADVTVTAPTTATQVTGMTVTVTIPSGGRTIKITCYSRYIFGTAASVNSIASLWDGAVNSGTKLQEWYVGPASGNTVGFCMVALVTPAAGSKTYNVGVQSSSGNITMGAASTAPAFILVEAL